jgi:RimJ/RimL family protein N-acetyltransferase
MLAETQEFVRGLMNKPQGAYAWVICLRGQGRAIGVVEFGIQDGVTGGVDYAMAQQYWNQGIMTEAVSAVLDWGFGTFPRLQTVSSGAMTVNKASRRVMEKCGMVFQKHVQEKWEKFDQPVELAIYAISRKKV